MPPATLQPAEMRIFLELCKAYRQKIVNESFTKWLGRNRFHPGASAHAQSFYVPTACGQKVGTKSGKKSGQKFKQILLHFLLHLSIFAMSQNFGSKS